MPEKKILIVDDYATMRQLLVMAVRKLDSIGQPLIIEAIDGREGYDKFQAQAFNLVLVDIKMPKMNGLELITKIRQESGNRNVPIIIISAKSEEEDIQRGLAAGADEYLLKPISMRRLKEMITKLIAI